MRNCAKTLAVTVLLAISASGCSLISIDPIPSPFPDSQPFGEVVREIRVEGNRYTKTWLVEAAMASRVGEPYTAESAQNDYRWLGGLGVFTSIDFRTEPVEDGIALIVAVKEVSPYVPGISFKLTQENGVEIGPSFSSPNFLGFAGRASAFARFGGATNFGVRYWDPWLPGKSWLFGYRVQYAHNERRNELDRFNETSDDLFLQVRRNITNDLRWGLRATFLSVKSDTTGITLDPDNRDNIPGLGLFLELDTRNGSYPTRGWYGDLAVAKHGIFGGDGDYWQLNADARRYLPLPFGRRHSLALYSLLTLTSGEIGEDIPIYMDFHIGGTNSVRGWPLGSRVGKNQWLNTAEYWFRLFDDRAFRLWFIKWRMGFQLALFGDVGTAWYDGPEFGENFIAGFGGGVRLTIPVVVLLRLDIAYAKDEFGLKFAVGGAEKAIAQKQRVR
jgi:outer membrane protein assembly factor BamA